MPRIVHTITDGFCTVCGDTAEWLEANDQLTDYVQDED